jgi:hypothetical protein
MRKGTISIEAPVVERRDLPGDLFSRAGFTAVVLLAVLATHAAFAQELEPRAYSANPIGANFLVAAYGYQAGDVLFDPSVPITNATAYVNSTVFGYGRSFGLFGRQASVGIVVPYVWLSMNGDVYEDHRDITRSGLADTRVKLTINLLGGPALTPREFMTRKHGTTLGVSLAVQAPTGQYDSTKLINLGTNRWSFKPELGLSHPMGRFTLELHAGAWFYTDNTDFFGGSRFEQDPLVGFQAHVAYSFQPRMWLALDGTFYAGGLTYNNGVAASERQQNSRIGLTFALPIGKQHSIKAAWAKGVTARVGDKVDIYSISYQFLWFDRQ